MSTLHFEVQGMSCGGCVKNVTAALTRLPGVSTVDVDLPQGGDPLVLALTAAGYPAKLTSAMTGSPPVKKSGGCCG